MKIFLESNRLTTSHVKGFRASKPAHLGLQKKSYLPGLLCLSLAIAFPAFALDGQQMEEYRNHINRGNALLSRRLWEQAIAEYEAAQAIDPANHVAHDNITLAHNNWGIYLYQCRKYQDAKQQWETALKMSPSDAMVRRNLKILETHLKQIAAAEAEKPAPAEKTSKPKPEDWDPLKESSESNGSARAGKDADSPAARPSAESSASSNQGASGTTLIGGTSTSRGSSGATPIGGTSTSQGASGATIIGGTSTSQGSSGATLIGGTSNSQGSSGESLNSSSGGSNNNSIKLPVASSTPNAATANNTVLNYNNSATYDSSIVYGTTPNSSVRIIGGSSGSASIIGSGSSTSASASAGTGQSNYYPGYNANFTPAGDGTITIRNTDTNSNTSQVSAGPSNNNGGGTAGPQIPAPGINSNHNKRYSLPGGGDVSGQTTSSVRQESGQSIAFSSSNSMSSPPANDRTAPAQTNTKAGDSSATVEDTLAKIENKVYGKVSKNMPILKRIERLEVDTTGKKSDGSIADRLNELKKTYGF